MTYNARCGLLPLIRVGLDVDEQHLDPHQILGCRPILTAQNDKRRFLIIAPENRMIPEFSVMNTGFHYNVWYPCWAGTC